MPQESQVTRHVCVEGWSMIGKWTGVPFRTFLARIGADTTAKYVGFECADGYYSSIDMASALHPQTLLTFKISDEILAPKFGYPLKLRVATKLGFKNPKWITAMYVTNRFPGRVLGGPGIQLVRRGVSGRRSFAIVTVVIIACRMSVTPQMPGSLSGHDPKSREFTASPAPARPGEVSWDYDRAEIIADGAVHAIGIVLGLVGAVAIVIAAIETDRIGLAPVVIYIIGLVAMLALSALYNMWPISPTKWVLRRFDHSAIYLLIAGTYTPFLAHLKIGLISIGSRHRRLGERGHRHGSQARASGAVRSPGGRAFPAARLERCDRLRVRSLPSSRLRAYGCSRSAAFSTRSAYSFMAGTACAFTTRSGMASCCWRRVATIRRFSPPWRRRD